MKRYRTLLALFVLLVFCFPAWAGERLTEMDEDGTPETNDLTYVVDDDLAVGSRRHKVQIKNLPQGFTSDTPEDEQCFTFEDTGTTYEWHE